MIPVSKILNNLGGKGTTPVDHPTVPILASLKANKTGMQLIAHLLAEWNNIELRQIGEKRCLVADLTLLWSRISDPDPQLVQLWRKLIIKFGDELKMRWEQSIKLRAVYENALDAMLDHLNPESIPDEEDLKLAAEANDEAQRAASKKHHKRERSNMHSSTGSSNGPATKILKMEKQDLLYRHKNSHLNCVRRQFQKNARANYPLVIEEQEDIALRVKKCVLAHSMARNKINYHLSRSNSNLTSSTTWISPFEIGARLQDKLERSLRLPCYHPLPYHDPRETTPRERILFGVDLADEESIENGLLAVLLQVARKNPPHDGFRKLKQACPNETVQLALYLETYWGPNSADNVKMILRQPVTLRHSLLMFYLECLPTPLLPLTAAGFTQFALMNLNARDIVKSMPVLNMGPLREICDYVDRMSHYDSKLLDKTGILLTRVKCDLMGDGSPGNTLAGLLHMLIRYFNREKERTVLDISPISVTWEQY